MSEDANTWSVRNDESDWETLEEFAASGHPTWRILTRRLLWMFGRERRGTVVNAEISQKLAELSLEMTPSIGEADYYGYVAISANPRDFSSEADQSNETSIEADIGVADRVGGWYLSALKDDAEELDFLVYGDSVETAITRMKQRGRTKLPLFFSEADRSTLIGTVTIADLSYENTNAQTKLIDRASKQVPVVGTAEKLFDWIPSILQHGFVYGKDGSGQVVQIYTVHDVAVHLNSVAAMFLRANELEELIRQILYRIPEEELQEARRRNGNLQSIPLDEEGSVHLTDSQINPPGSEPDEAHVADTYLFSDYMKCFGDKTIWARYFKNVNPRLMDKTKCLTSLNDARLARNRVMHFNRQESLETMIPSFECLAVWLRYVAQQQDPPESD